jgi:predicted transcriptional regulator
LIDESRHPEYPREHYLNILWSGSLYKWDFSKHIWVKLCLDDAAYFKAFFEGIAHMEKKLLELTVQIVQAQASISKMTAVEIEQALVRVYNALNQMRRAEEQERSILPGEAAFQASGVPVAANPLSSIQEDKVTCMECKAELRQLTANHLRIHHLTPREYKKKWGFPLKQPLSAKNLTKLRSRSAKKRGLPENLKIYLDRKRENKTASVRKIHASRPVLGKK